jgi:hypothetical protein
MQMCMYGELFRADALLYADLHALSLSLSLSLSCIFFAYMRAYMRAYIHACVHVCIDACIHAYIHTWLRREDELREMHPYMHTYTYIHTSIHASIIHMYAPHLHPTALAPPHQHLIFRRLILNISLIFARIYIRKLLKISLFILIHQYKHTSA